MSSLTLRGCAGETSGALQGSVIVPGDKSISHRALMLAALAEGTSRVEGILPSGDCLATLACMRDLGVSIEQESDDVETTLLIQGQGLHGLVPPEGPLNCSRSGTTMRLLSGILVGQAFDSVLTGEPQLLRRPMRRITDPLRQMGAAVSDTDGHGPLRIQGQVTLHGLRHVLPIASAQVKSALLLAGLYADSPTEVLLPGPARDHTERMLLAQAEVFQSGPAFLTYDGVAARLDPSAFGHLRPLSCSVPGDFSSSTFILAAGLCLPGSTVTVTGVGVNPTRTGLADVLLSMGAELVFENTRVQGGEPVADIMVRASALKSTVVEGATVVRMIDEFPILAVVATQASGTTIIRDAAELRVKESDRIASVVDELRKLGAVIEPRDDGFVVEGPTALHGAVVDSQGDHRLGMALVVAGLIARNETTVLGAERMADSFPGFVATLRRLGAVIDEHE